MDLHALRVQGVGYPWGSRTVRLGIETYKQQAFGSSPSGLRVLGFGRFLFRAGGFGAQDLGARAQAFVFKLSLA